MNITSFDIKNTLTRLKATAKTLTPIEFSHTAAIMSIYRTLNNIVFGGSVYFLLDTDGQVAINPLSYIPPCAENQNREFLRIYSRSLVEQVQSIKKTWFRIVRNNAGVVYSPKNPKLSGMDSLFLFAAHEIRHKVQASCRLFTPQSEERRRAFLGVALDVLKLHLRDCPGHYNQSGKGKIESEFDAEVVAMYAANLWRVKTPEEIKQMLLAEPV